MPVLPGAPAIEARAPVTGVMIGTPMYGGQAFDAYVLGLWDFQAEAHRHGTTVALCTIRNESHITRGRNRILADFMESPCSHLVFIDADIGFSARDVFRLVAHGKPVVGATYGKKDRDKYAPAFVPLPGPVFQREDDGLAEVQCLPGGFLCLHREAVAQLRGHFHDLWYWDQHGERKRRIHDLCGTYTDANRQWWSEDYALCNRWREAGGQVWLDPFISLSHNGTTTFEGDPRTIFRDRDAPTAAPAPAIPFRRDHATPPPLPPAGEARERLFPGPPTSHDERVALHRIARGAPIEVYGGPVNLDRSMPPREPPAEPATVADTAGPWHSIGQGDLRPVPSVLP